jgi:hypothetical protein
LTARDEIVQVLLTGLTALWGVFTTRASPYGVRKGGAPSGSQKSPDYSGLSGVTPACARRHRTSAGFVLTHPHL